MPKKKSKSPTQLTLEWLRKRGCLARVTERWNAFAMKRLDVFGGDILAIAGKDLLNIQATSATNHSARLAKSLANPEIRAWLGTGNTFQVWSWRKRAYVKPNGVKTRVLKWTPRITQIELLDGELITKPFIVKI